MRSQIGLLSLVGLLSLLATADAQTPPRSAAITAFDGTYRLVSTAKVNQTYRSRAGQMLLCSDRTPGPLTIVNGHAKYTTETGNELDGTVGPNGGLDLRFMTGAGNVHGRPMEMRTTAQIDSTGTVHAHQRGGSCSYDYVWQKQ
jgi:hypothetical protein